MKGFIIRGFIWDITIKVTTRLSKGLLKRVAIRRMRL